MSAPFATAAGVPVARGTITYLRTGVALADLFIARSSDTARSLGFGAGDPVEVVVTDKDERVTTFRMTCWRVGVEGGFYGAALCGGRARLGRVLEPRYYEEAPGAKILGDALRECGEDMAGATTLTAPLGIYVRRRGPAYRDVAALLACYPDATWRTLPDGTIWAGEETWPESPLRVVVLQRTPQFRRVLCEAAPEVRCGTIVQDNTTKATLGGVERVVHEMTAVLRTELWLRLVGE